MISSVVFYGCETWSLALRRNIDGGIGPKIEEAARELHDLYFSPNIIGVTRSITDGRGKRHVWGTGEVRTEYWRADLREGGHL